MLPPPPDTSQDLPRLVEFDDEAALYNAVPREQADTWRPTGYESDSPEACP